MFWKGFTSVHGPYLLKSAKYVVLRHHKPDLLESAVIEHGIP